MCGIFGGSPDLLCAETTRLLAHRGPDQAGHVELRTPGGEPFVMGQTRLAVVLKDPVATPMQRAGATISYNGEVYNWREVRAELEALGQVFETETDTEVVLAAYLEWGPRCLDRLNGMFAIAIWQDDRLFLARDRLGKKPLFYTTAGGRFAFASELKAFQQLDFDEVPICQALEFYFDEHTPFRDVRSVKPGEYLTYAPDTRTLRASTWWTFPAPDPTVHDEKEAVTAFLELFTDACRIRKVADVPVTIFLSGGVDSSLIQAVLKLDVSYTVQFAEFEETINERAFVTEYAARLGFEPRIVTPTREDFLASFSDLARFIEFPVGSFSVYPLFCVARQARADGFVVALSGEGADELFNGYFRNELLLREAAQVEADLAGPYGTLCRRYFGSELERFCRMASRHGLADQKVLVDFFRPRWKAERSFAQNLSLLESTVFLQPLLVMADRLSMASSLEVRNPFLDHRLVTLSTRISDALKYRDGQGKWILRRALASLVGTDLGVTQRRIKHGLPAPVNQWLFKSAAFDRRDWNHVLLGECLKQLALAREPPTT